MSSLGLVFNVQRFSLQDGPGIRTIVFLKGCPLRCAWCSNPESQHTEPELYYSTTNCIRCNSCYAVCGEKAIDPDKFGPKRIDRMKCSRCFECCSICPTESLIRKGEYRSVDSIVEEVLRDSDVFSVGMGGVTFSGGEPFMQPVFLLECLKAFKEKGISTVIESCACTQWMNIENAIDYVDEFYIDIKHMDSKRHMEATGGGNEQILNNIRNIARAKKKLTIRMPLIPGFNDTEDNLTRLASFLKEIELPAIHLLPYHSFGEPKYAALGRKYLIMPELTELVDGAVNKAESILDGLGIEVFKYS